MYRFYSWVLYFIRPCQHPYVTFHIRQLLSYIRVRISSCTTHKLTSVCAASRTFPVPDLEFLQRQTRPYRRQCGNWPLQWNVGRRQFTFWKERKPTNVGTRCRYQNFPCHTTQYRTEPVPTSTATGTAGDSWADEFQVPYFPRIEVSLSPSQSLQPWKTMKQEVLVCLGRTASSCEKKGDHRLPKMLDQCASSL